MKKLIALFLIVGMLSGCAVVCSHKSQITNILNGIVSDAQALVAMLSTQIPIPPEAYVIIAAAQQAQAVAEAALQKACPTVADVESAQTAINNAVQAAKMQGMRLK